MEGTQTAIAHARQAIKSMAWALSYDRLLRDLERHLFRRANQHFERTGIALVHVPKAAGSSLSAALYGMGIGHQTWDEMQRMSPDGFARWLTIAVVRDPIDRFLSAYDYLLRGGTTPFDRAFRRRFLRRDPPVARFIAERLRPPAERARILRWLHFRPQAEFVLNASGEVMVRRLIPFDRLEEMVPAVLPPGTHLPRLNPTPGTRTTPDALSPQDAGLLLEIYGTDAALVEFARDAGGADVFGRALGPRSGPVAAGRAT